MGDLITEARFWTESVLPRGLPKSSAPGTYLQYPGHGNLGPGLVPAF